MSSLYLSLLEWFRNGTARFTIELIPNTRTLLISTHERARKRRNKINNKNQFVQAENFSSQLLCIRLWAGGPFYSTQNLVSKLVLGLSNSIINHRPNLEPKQASCAPYAPYTTWCMRTHTWCTPWCTTLRLGLFLLITTSHVIINCTCC